MSRWVFILIFFLPDGLWAQDKFLARLDTSRVGNTWAKDSSSLVELTTHSLWNEEFIPVDYDHDFLNAALAGYINHERQKRSRKPLLYSEELYSVSYYFLQYFSLQSFQFDPEKNDRYTKLAKKSAKKIQYPKGIIKTAIFRLPAINFKGGAFYYDKEDETTSMKLFYGTKPTKKEMESEIPPKQKKIETWTYSGFVKQFYKHHLSAKIHSLLFSKEFSSVACCLVVDKRTLNTNRIPQVSCMVIFGANRLEKAKTVSPKKNQNRLLK